MPDTSKRARSLRGRFFVTTGIVFVLCSGVAAINYRQTVLSNQEHTREIEQVARLITLTGGVRTELSELYREMDEFLIDPTLSKGQEIILHSRFGALDSFTQITLESTHNNELIEQFSALQLEINQLKIHMEALFETRIDPKKQYPALAISSDFMDQAQASASGGLQVLIEELREEGFAPQKPDLLADLLKAQLHWSRIQSQYRIYLANRLASFSLERMRQQADSVAEMYENFEEGLKKLQVLYEREPNSFDGPEVMSQVRLDSRYWHDNFKRIRKINDSSSWREDIHLKQRNVLPLVKALYERTELISDLLEIQSQKRFDAMLSSNRKMNLLIGGVIGVFLLFILGMLMSMEFLMFRPIGKVTQALKSRAFGIDNPQFYRNLSKETRELVDAFEEMNAEVTSHERMLEHQALHDPLTGLPNRAMLNERLKYHIARASRNRDKFCLMLIDLNNFRDVNDALGHQIGDQLLIHVAQSLEEQLGEDDSIARLGGDEFAILLPETNREQVTGIAVTLKHVFREPFQIEKYNLKTDASIGISVYPEDGLNSASLLQRADVAMYEAKRGKSDFAFYNPSADNSGPHQVTLISDLHAAIEEGQLELHFQPQMRLSDGKIYGAEALVRWKHPEFGRISPDRIVEMAQHSGAINRLTGWVLGTAIRHCAEWHRRGYPISISVNISVHNLGQDLFASRVERALNKHGLDSRYLTLEITENEVMLNPGRAIEMLERLRKLGIKLSVDDYGTGFSSLTYLRRLPVMALKIDKSFVLQMEQQASDQVIVKSTIEMGHNLGLVIVAEGVETIEAREMLRRMNCDSIQGYLLSKPVAGDEFAIWLKYQSTIGSEEDASAVS